MAKKIIIPEEELHDIADAINNRADYLDDINNDTSVRDSLVETSDRQMYSSDMKSNILKLRVNLSRYYTKEEIDEMINSETIDMVYVSGDLDDIPEEEISDRTLYIVNDGNDRYSVWTWRNNNWLMISDSVRRSDFNNYYTRAEIDACCNTKQDKLTAGNNITITEDNVISANINRKYKYVADVNEPVGEFTTGTFEEVDNPNDDPIFAILGASPVYLTLDEGSNGYIVININPDALEGSQDIALTDSSTKVATTKFVGEKIADEISKLSHDGVTYIIFNSRAEEAQYPEPKKDGVIYANNETGNVYFGNRLLNAIVWNTLTEEYTYTYVLYHSGFTDLPDRTSDIPIDVSSTLTSYKDVFYNPWKTSDYIEMTARKISDTSVTHPVTATTTIDELLEAFHITDVGDESNPVIDIVPTLPVSDPCPWLGWSENGGSFVSSYSSDNIYKLEEISEPYNEDTPYRSVYIFQPVPQFNETSSTSQPIQAYSPGRQFLGWCTSDSYYEGIEETGSKLNPEIVDWSWSGGLFAAWEDMYYQDLQQLFNEYSNDPVDEYDSTTTSRKVNMYDYDESDYDNVAYRKVSVGIATKQNNVWVLNSIFEDMGDMSEFLLSEFQDGIRATIADLIDTGQLEPVPVSTVNPITESVPSENTIFAIYIEGYTGTGEDITIVSQYMRILKGWASNSTITYR